MTQSTTKHRESRRRRPLQPLGREHAPDAPVSVHDMTVAYRRRPVLWDIDFDVPSGGLVGIIGPNGAGKSTLLKACLDLVPRASGEVRLFGQPYADVRRWVAYVPQRETVDWEFPVTALDVVTMGTYGRLGWFRPVGRTQKAQSMEALDRVGLADFAGRQISQLSGGQQQRVFIARALAQRADLYFMDEPFAGVDAATEQAIIELLRTMRDSGGTVLVVHHDLQSAPLYFDHVIMLNTRLVAVGPTEAVFNNENLQRTYGGTMTLLDQAAQALARTTA